MARYRVLCVTRAEPPHVLAARPDSNQRILTITAEGPHGQVTWPPVTIANLLRLGDEFYIDDDDGESKIPLQHYGGEWVRAVPRPLGRVNLATCPECSYR